MPRLPDRPLRRICTRLFDEDIDMIDKLADAAGQPRDLFLRTIVHIYCVRAADKIRQRIDASESVHE